MTRTSLAFSRYQTNEYDYIAAPLQGWLQKEPNLALYLHGSGSNAQEVAQGAYERDLVLSLAADHVVHVGDYGYETWGNDTGIARIHTAITYMRANWGVSGPVTLVCASMGAANAFAYTLAHPENVKAVAAVIPLIDLADLYSRGFTTQLNTAYGGSYNDAVDGPNHSPIQFADRLPADLPIHLWSVPNDSLTPVETAQAFVAIRPQTGFSMLPEVPHGAIAVDAAKNDVLQFIRSL